uniref:Uncharacterized protein LOC111099810 n=1 Tax=Crassostrea virginica TaxID=6565 RepID=A0A8B8A689_CRAVI|nr:uncharacterized protein LOC111099810 [Crassostrea virginica]
MLVYVVLKEIILNACLVWSFFQANVFGEVHISTCSLKAVVKVNSCPKGQRDWLEASDKKGCNRMISPCANSKPFVYHCVENHWGNKTFEICAPLINIIGHSCPEYNQGGGIIQGHLNKSCNGSQFSRSCPFKYKSNKVYRYQQCYSYWKAEDQRMSTQTEKFTGEATTSITTTIGPITVDRGNNKLLFLCLIPFLVIIGVLGVCMHKKWTRNRDLPGRVTTEVIPDNLRKDHQSLLPAKSPF